MGDACILSHGGSSPVLISLILNSEIKTLPVLTSTPKADANLLLQLLFLSKTCSCGLAYILLFFMWTSHFSECIIIIK